MDGDNGQTSALKGAAREGGGQRVAVRIPPERIGLPPDRSLKTSEHPTALAYRARKPPAVSGVVAASELREIALAAGAEDVGFASVADPSLIHEQPYAEKALPGARSYMAFVVRLNRSNMRTVQRSVGNVEFHNTGEYANEVGRRISRALEDRGFRAINPAMGFPQEVQEFPRRMWVISHKEVAIAAGLGHMGIHRSIIHPKFGSFILLGTVILDVEIDTYSKPLEWNPCLGCNLCVAACPVGAIHPDGDFDFLECYTHNYRELLTGFNDYVEQVADSTDGDEFRSRVGQTESLSMWQSLALHPNYKAAYCISVCPAGEDVIGPFLEDRARHLREVVKPLQQREELIYVMPGSSAESHVRRRFPHKTVRLVSNAIRPPEPLDQIGRGRPEYRVRPARLRWLRTAFGRLRSARSADGTAKAKRTSDPDG